jgi:hypothetical protein
VVPYVTTTPTGTPGVPWWSTAGTHATTAQLIRSGGHNSSGSATPQALRLNADGTVALASASAHHRAGGPVSGVAGWPAAVGIGAIAALGLATAWQLRRRRAGGAA